MANTPKIRFKGFTDAWEQRKLYEVADFNPKSELPEVFEYVDLESVVGTEMISHRTETKDTAPSRAQRLAQKGDVFFQTVRPYQRNNYLFEKPDNNYVFSTGYAQMRPKIDAKFLMSFLQTDSFVKVVLDNCTGTSYPAINSNDLSNLEISLPVLMDEQRRIGSFITNLDNLITLHQRIGYVKSLIYETIAFSWEQRKLSDVVDVYDGVHQTPEYKDEGIMFLSVENIATLKSEKYISEEAFERDYKIYPEKGDILMTRIGDIGTPNVVETAEKVAFYVSLALLKPHGIDSYFLNNAIQSKSFQKGLRERSLLTAIPMKINKDEIGKVDVCIPKNIDEQKEIGKAFKGLDNLITLHQRKYNRWRCFICKIQLKTIYFMTITHIGFVFIRRGRLGRSP